MKKMKIFILTFASFVFSSSFAMNNPIAIDNQNPFVEDAKDHRDPKTEPQGVSIYSFAENPNLVTEISKDETYLREVNQTRSFGYTRVSDSRVANFDELILSYKQQKEEYDKRNFQRLPTADGKGADHIKYSFSNTDIVSHLPGTSQLLLESPAGNYIVGKGWDARIKIVNNSDLGRIIFREWHYAASDGGVVMDSNAMNHYIKGNPATLIIRVTESGRAETVLSWADSEKSYTVQIDKNINELRMMKSLNDFSEAVTAAYIPMTRLEY